MPTLRESNLELMAQPQHPFTSHRSHNYSSPPPSHTVLPPSQLNMSSFPNEGLLSSSLPRSDYSRGVVEDTAINTSLDISTPYARFSNSEESKSADDHGSGSSVQLLRAPNGVKKSYNFRDGNSNYRQPDSQENSNYRQLNFQENSHYDHHSIQEYSNYAQPDLQENSNFRNINYSIPSEVSHDNALSYTIGTRSKSSDKAISLSEFCDRVAPPAQSSILDRVVFPQPEEKGMSTSQYPDLDRSDSLMNLLVSTSSVTMVDSNEISDRSQKSEKFSENQDKPFLQKPSSAVNVPHTLEKENVSPGKYPN